MLNINVKEQSTGSLVIGEDSHLQLVQLQI